MGKTAYSGPVYGAQSVLLYGRIADVSSGAGDGVSTQIGRIVVPRGQDWFLTDFQAARTSTGSTGLGFSLLANSTVLSSLTINSSLADASSLAQLTPDGGEYAGVRVAQNTTLTVRVAQSSVAPASSGVYISVHGFVRYAVSTRNAEVQ